MPFAELTRPDDTPIFVSSKEVVFFAPVPPPTSGVAGPLTEGTRIQFRGGGHQDVKEKVDKVKAIFES